MTVTESARRMVNTAWHFFMQFGAVLLHGVVVALVLFVKIVEGLLATSQDQSGAGFIDQQAKLSKQEVDTSEPSTLLDFKHGESNQLHVFGSPYRGLEEEQQGTEAVATEELAEYTGKVEGVPAVLSVPPAAAHGNQTGTAFIPEERQANTEAPSQHDGIPKTALQTQDELDGGHPDTSHPSELSTKIDALQTKTATVMHRLERIETPKEMRDEGNDGNQVFSNVAPAPETPLSGAIQIHGPTVLSGPGEDSEARNITEKKSAAEPEREKGALASGDATVQLSQQGRAEFNSKPGTSNSNQGPQVPKGPKEGTVPVQGDIKRAANPTGRRRPFQRITKGFKRMFA